MTGRPAPSPIGLIVNPIAGMGGRVALKGTDGVATVAKARALGAEPLAQQRAIRALKKLRASAPDAGIVTIPGAMGSEAASAAEFGPKRADIEGW